MPAISRQRARSPQDKDLRRAHLIQAATRLFADADFEAVTIARVAEAAGVAKGAAYIYFVTKETLFLELVRAELTQWLAALTVTLKRLRSPRPAAAVPAAIAKSLSVRPLLRRLLVLALHSVIEPKIDEPSAREFRLFLRDVLLQASQPADCRKNPRPHTHRRRNPGASNPRAGDQHHPACQPAPGDCPCDGDGCQPASHAHRVRAVPGANSHSACARLGA